MDNVIRGVDDASPALTDSEKTDKAKQASPPAPRASRFVRYTGAREEWASMRRITSQAWATLGIKGVQTNVWSLSNDWRIPASQFSEAQLDYLLDVDGRFELADAAGKIVAR